MSLIKSKSSFPCPHCNKVCSMRGSLVMHMNVHHKPPAQPKISDRICGLCGKLFTLQQNLQIHIRKMHLRERTHGCSFCEAAFFHKQELAIHLRRTHTGEKPFKCTVSGCPKAYTSLQGLNTHTKNIHLEIRSHSCQQCEKAFPTLHRLNVHVCTHTGEKPLSCVICGKKFKYSGTLWLHKEKHDGNKRQSCSFCLFQCVSTTSLNNHMRTHTKEKEFTCAECRRAFGTKANLKKHEATQHSDVGKEETHDCSLCGKKFVRAASLVHHNRRMHTEEKEGTTCEECGKRLPNKILLKEHIRLHERHAAGKPHSCSLCEKSYKSKNGLVLHISAHTGEKPFSCDVCEMSFSTNSALEFHKQIHDVNRERKFQCKFCGTKFYGKGSMKDHVKKYCKKRGGKQE